MAPKGSLQCSQERYVCGRLGKRRQKQYLFAKQEVTRRGKLLNMGLHYRAAYSSKVLKTVTNPKRIRQMRHAE